MLLVGSMYVLPWGVICLPKAVGRCDQGRLIDFDSTNNLLGFLRESEYLLFQKEEIVQYRMLERERAEEKRGEGKRKALNYLKIHKCGILQAEIPMSSQESWPTEAPNHLVSTISSAVFPLPANAPSTPNSLCLLSYRGTLKGQGGWIGVSW